MAEEPNNLYSVNMSELPEITAEDLGYVLMESSDNYLMGDTDVLTSEAATLSLIGTEALVAELIELPELVDSVVPSVATDAEVIMSLKASKMPELTDPEVTNYNFIMSNTVMEPTNLSKQMDLTVAVVTTEEGVVTHNMEVLELVDSAVPIAATDADGMMFYEVTEIPEVTESAVVEVTNDADVMMFSTVTYPTNLSEQVHSTDEGVVTHYTGTEIPELTDSAVAEATNDADNMVFSIVTEPTNLSEQVDSTVVATEEGVVTHNTTMEVSELMDSTTAEVTSDTNVMHNTFTEQPELIEIATPFELTDADLLMLNTVTEGSELLGSTSTIVTKDTDVTKDGRDVESEREETCEDTGSSEELRDINELKQSSSRPSGLSDQIRRSFRSCVIKKRKKNTGIKSVEQTVSNEVSDVAALELVDSAITDAPLQSGQGVHPLINSSANNVPISPPSSRKRKQQLNALNSKMCVETKVVDGALAKIAKIRSDSKSPKQIIGSKKLVSNKNSSNKSDTSYYCPTCSTLFQSEVSFNRHLCINSNGNYKKGGNKTKLKNEAPKLLSCSACSEFFPSKIFMDLHKCVDKSGNKSEKKEATVIVCPACSKRFTSNESFDSHKCLKGESEKKDVTLYSCSACLRRFSTKISFESHGCLNSEVHQPKKKYICFFCPNLFLTQESFDSHVCGKKAENELVRKDVVFYSCSACTIHFSSKETFDRHGCWNRGEKELDKKGIFYYCSSCTRRFPSKASFGSHECLITAANQSEKKDVILYYCSICSKLFRTKLAFDSHECLNIAENVSEKNDVTLYSCSACTIRFSSKESFDRHACLTRTEDHSKKKDVALCYCSVCSKWFMSKMSLVRHKCDKLLLPIQSEKTEVIFYSCSECPERFVSKEIFDLHKCVTQYNCSQESEQTTRSATKKTITLYPAPESLPKHRFKKVCSGCLKNIDHLKTVSGVNTQCQSCAVKSNCCFHCFVKFPSKLKLISHSCKKEKDVAHFDVRKCAECLQTFSTISSNRWSCKKCIEAQGFSSRNCRYCNILFTTPANKPALVCKHCFDYLTNVSGLLVNSNTSHIGTIELRRKEESTIVSVGMSIEQDSYEITKKFTEERRNSSNRQLLGSLQLEFNSNDLAILRKPFLPTIYQPVRSLVPTINDQMLSYLERMRSYQHVHGYSSPEQNAETLLLRMMRQFVRNVSNHLPVKYSEEKFQDTSRDLEDADAAKLKVQKPLHGDEATQCFSSQHEYKQNQSKCLTPSLGGSLPVIGNFWSCIKRNMERTPSHSNVIIRLPTEAPAKHLLMIDQSDTSITKNTKVVIDYKKTEMAQRSTVVDSTEQLDSLADSLNRQGTSRLPLVSSPWRFSGLESERENRMLQNISSTNFPVENPMSTVAEQFRNISKKTYETSNERFKGDEVNSEIPKEFGTGLPRTISKKLHKKVMEIVQLEPMSTVAEQSSNISKNTFDSFNPETSTVALQDTEKNSETGKESFNSEFPLLFGEPFSLHDVCKELSRLPVPVKTVHNCSLRLLLQAKEGEEPETGRNKRATFAGDNKKRKHETAFKSRAPPTRSPIPLKPAEGKQTTEVDGGSSSSLSGCQITPEDETATMYLSKRRLFLDVTDCEVPEMSPVTEVTTTTTVRERSPVIKSELRTMLESSQSPSPSISAGNCAVRWTPEMESGGKKCTDCWRTIRADKTKRNTKCYRCKKKSLRKQSKVWTCDKCEKKFKSKGERNESNKTCLQCQNKEHRTITCKQCSKEFHLLKGIVYFQPYCSNCIKTNKKLKKFQIWTCSYCGSNIKSLASTSNRRCSQCRQWDSKTCELCSKRFQCGKKMIKSNTCSDCHTLSLERRKNVTIEDKLSTCGRCLQTFKEDISCTNPICLPCKAKNNVATVLTDTRTAIAGSFGKTIIKKEVNIDPSDSDTDDGYLDVLPLATFNATVAKPITADKSSIEKEVNKESLGTVQKDKGYNIKTEIDILQLSHHGLLDEGPLSTFQCDMSSSITSNIDIAQPNHSVEPLRTFQQDKSTFITSDVDTVQFCHTEIANIVPLNTFQRDMSTSITSNIDIAQPNHTVVLIEEPVRTFLKDKSTNITSSVATCQNDAVNTEPLSILQCDMSTSTTSNIEIALPKRKIVLDGEPLRTSQQDTSANIDSIKSCHKEVVNNEQLNTLQLDMGKSISLNVDIVQPKHTVVLDKEPLRTFHRDKSSNIASNVAYAKSGQKEVVNEEELSTLQQFMAPNFAKHSGAEKPFHETIQKKGNMKSVDDFQHKVTDIAANMAEPAVTVALSQEPRQTLQREMDTVTTKSIAAVTPYSENVPKEVSTESLKDFLRDRGTTITTNTDAAKPCYSKAVPQWRDTGTTLAKNIAIVKPCPRSVKLKLNKESSSLSQRDVTTNITSNIQIVRHYYKDQLNKEPLTSTQVDTGTKHAENSDKTCLIEEQPEIIIEPTEFDVDTDIDEDSDGIEILPIVTKANKGPSNTVKRKKDKTNNGKHVNKRPLSAVQHNRDKNKVKNIHKEADNGTKQRHNAKSISRPSGTEVDNEVTIVEFDVDTDVDSDLDDIEVLPLVREKRKNTEDEIECLGDFLGPGPVDSPPEFELVTETVTYLRTVPAPGEKPSVVDVVSAVKVVDDPILKKILPTSIARFDKRRKELLPCFVRLTRLRGTENSTHSASQVSKLTAKCSQRILMLQRALRLLRRTAEAKPIPYDGVAMETFDCSIILEQTPGQTGMFH